MSGTLASMIPRGATVSLGGRRLLVDRIHAGAPKGAVWWCVRDLDAEGVAMVEVRDTDRLEVLSENLHGPG